jgi:hypothetical protein
MEIDEQWRILQVVFASWLALAVKKSEFKTFLSSPVIYPGFSIIPEISLKLIPVFWVLTPLQSYIWT